MKRRIIFENGLEYWFYQAYHMLPFDMIETMVNQGYTHTYAFCTVQKIMDNLWEREKEKEAERERRDLALLEYNPFTQAPGAPT